MVDFYSDTRCPVLSSCPVKYFSACTSALNTLRWCSGYPTDGRVILQRSYRNVVHFLPFLGESIPDARARMYLSGHNEPCPLSLTVVIELRALLMVPALSMFYYTLPVLEPINMLRPDESH